MPKNIVDQKARNTIPNSGLGRVVNEQAWGDAKATERYGGGTQTFPPPRDQSQPQAPEDRQAANYHNDTANDWRRGNGERPNYDGGYHPSDGKRDRGIPLRAPNTGTGKRS